jgi:hypothetical protein
MNLRMSTVLLATLVMSSTLAANDFSAFYKTPEVRGLFVDWCHKWGQNCGQKAANAFCRTAGYEEAEGFHWETGHASVTKPALVLGDEQLCRDAGCGVLLNVRCLGYAKNQVFEYMKTRSKRCSKLVRFEAKHGIVEVAKGDTASFFWDPRLNKLRFTCGDSSRSTRFDRGIGTSRPVFATDPEFLVKVTRPREGRKMSIEFFSAKDWKSQ